MAVMKPRVPRANHLLRMGSAARRRSQDWAHAGWTGHRWPGPESGHSMILSAAVSSPPHTKGYRTGLPRWASLARALF